MSTKREETFWAYLGAVRDALDGIPETAKEAIEDASSAYFEALDEEGFEYEEGWEEPIFNSSSENPDPQEGLAFVCNTPPMTERMKQGLDNLGKALKAFVDTEDKAALEKAVEENSDAIKRSGFSLFVAEEKGFKEIK